MPIKINTKLRTAMGVSLIIFGLAGMILPVLPGWWVALIGLEILGWKLVIDRHKPWGKVVTFEHKIEGEHIEE